MKRQISIVLLICFCLFASEAFAQDTRDNIHFKNVIKLKLELVNKIVPVLLDLNLTQNQKSEIHGIIVGTLLKNKNDIVDLLGMLEDHCLILDQEAFDESRFRASFQEMAAAAEELAVAKAKAVFQIKKILDSEQVQKAIQLRKDVMKILKDHLSQFGVH